MKRIVMLLAPAAFLLAISQASAAVMYSLTDLGMIPGTYFQPEGMNDLGQVVGFSVTSGDATDQAYLWTSSNGFTPLGTLGGQFSQAFGINNSGQIVGYAALSNGSNNAFLKNGSGPLQNLGSFGGGYGASNAINNNGQIAGWAGYPNDSTHAFISNNGGPLQDLGTIGGNDSFASAISNNGEVVGDSTTAIGNYFHAFTYSGNGPMQDIGTLGGLTSEATSVNDSGQVVGYALTSGSGNQHAFLYNGSGSLIDLGTFGGQGSSAWGINDSGQIVGDAGTSGGGTHAFIYTSGTMLDLNVLIPSNSGWTLDTANAINDEGQILGVGINASGQQDTFILTPTPEPSSIVLFIAGIVGLLVFARRRGFSEIKEKDMARFPISSVRKWRLISVALVALTIVIIPGCGNSHAYKEGYESATTFVHDMSRQSAMVGGTGFSAKELDDPEKIEAQTGASMPYAIGSSDRTEWLQGYRDGIKKAVSDGY